MGNHLCNCQIDWVYCILLSGSASLGVGESGLKAMGFKSEGLNVLEPCLLIAFSLVPMGLVLGVVLSALLMHWHVWNSLLVPVCLEVLWFFKGSKVT